MNTFFISFHFDIEPDINFQNSSYVSFRQYFKILSYTPTKVFLRSFGYVWFEIIRVKKCKIYT